MTAVERASEKADVSLLRRSPASGPLRIPLQAAAIWLASRAGIVLLTYFAVLLNNPLTRTGVPASPLAYSSAVARPSTMVESWMRWDAGWFTDIASKGYVDVPMTAFFPLYPMLIRAVSGILVVLHAPLPGSLGPLSVSALSVSALASLVAFVAIGVLALRETGSERVAWRALAITAAFPFAFFLAAPYSEATFVAFAALTLLFARRGRWVAAGLAAFLAGLTRNTGVILILPLVWEFGHQHGWWSLAARRGSQAGGARLSLDPPIHDGALAPMHTIWRPVPSGPRSQSYGYAHSGPRCRPTSPCTWTPIRSPRIGGSRLKELGGGLLLTASVPLAVTTYMAYLWLRFGDPLAFVAAERHWTRVLIPPWQTAHLIVVNLSGMPAWGYSREVTLLNLALFLLFAALTTVLTLTRRMPVSFALYMAGLLCISVAVPAVGEFDVLHSLGRFLLVGFPLFIGLAGLLVRRPALELFVVGGGFLVQASLATFFLTGGWVA
jgi:hypothetical protein